MAAYYEEKLTNGLGHEVIVCVPHDKYPEFLAAMNACNANARFPWILTSLRPNVKRLTKGALSYTDFCGAYFGPVDAVAEPVPATEPAPVEVPAEPAAIVAESRCYSDDEREAMQIDGEINIHGEKDVAIAAIDDAAKQIGADIRVQDVPWNGKNWSEFLIINLGGKLIRVNHGLGGFYPSNAPAEIVKRYRAIAAEPVEESDPYQEGIEAGLGGALDADNPYPIGSDDAMDWEDGRSSNSDEDDQTEEAAQACRANPRKVDRNAHTALEDLDAPAQRPGHCPDCNGIADLYDQQGRAVCTHCGAHHSLSALVRHPAPPSGWRRARDYARLLAMAPEVDMEIDRQTVRPLALPPPGGYAAYCPAR